MTYCSFFNDAIREQPVSIPGFKERIYALQFENGEILDVHYRGFRPRSYDFGPRLTEEIAKAVQGISEESGQKQSIQEQKEEAVMLEVRYFDHTLWCKVSDIQNRLK